MKQVSLLILASLPVLFSADAEDPTAGPAPSLLRVEEALRAALADADPGPFFEYPQHAKSLVVKYRTRKFMVHSRTKSGKHSEKAREVEGPSYKGFLLTVRLQKVGTPNQAVVPQTLASPYWRTDLDFTPIPGTDKQLYTILSYGTRVNKNLLKQVKEAITGSVREDNGE